MNFERDTVQPLTMDLVLTKFGEILKGEENDISYIAQSDDQKHRYCYKGNAYSVHGLRKKGSFHRDKFNRFLKLPSQLIRKCIRFT